MSDLADKAASLLQLSHELGRKEHGLAILGEGNTSCRLDADTFLVTASGSSLGVLREDQLVACRFSALLPLLDVPMMSDSKVEHALLASRVDPSAPKPSVEALFHAWLLTLPGIDVIGHTHPITVGQILCAGDEAGRRFADERRFPDEILCCGARSILVPYVDLGAPLAKSIRDHVRHSADRENHPPRVILLRNHGLIACGTTTGAVLAATLMAEKAARIYTGAIAMGGPTMLSPQNVARIDARPEEHYR